MMLYQIIPMKFRECIFQILAKIKKCFTVIVWHGRPMRFIQHELHSIK